MLTLIAVACISRSWAPTADFVVSPNGDDNAAGTAKRPFRTLEKARDAVRVFRSAHPEINRSIVVLLKSGTYELAQPFKLAPEDSGTASSPTVYVGDHAVLSGGRQIRGFQTDSHGWWKITLPEVREGSWRFAQLFVNGQRRYRPRFPKQGYYNFTAELPPSEAAKGHGYDRFAYRQGDVNPNWSNLSDIEVLCFHIWDMSRMRIGAVDPSATMVTTTGPTGYDAGWANFPKGNRYIVENVREGLSDPGEWYLDNKTGELTYIPLPGEKPESAQVVAPKIPRLLEIDGDWRAKKYVENVNFRGISFSNCNWTLGPQGRFFPQAEVDLSAAIHAEGWRNSTMVDCQVSHTGEYGIEMGAGCRQVSVERCKLSDLGAGGVKIGETNIHDDEQDAAQDITVRYSDIAHNGRLHPAAIGVWIGQSPHINITNNRIHDLYYTGVSVGWTWGYSKSQAHDNLIAFNDIYDIGQGVLSDMGGIYTLGVQPGTTLMGNRIHDVDSFSYGGWGIYPDEGSSNELIEDNLIYRTKSGGFHQHYGQGNIVRNNIFAFAREAEIIRTRAEDHLSFTFEHNIVYWKNAPLLGSNWSGNNYKLDNNLYWRTDGKPVDFAGMTLAAWQAKGQDAHSLIADPLFANPEKDDFTLRRASPAFKIGFNAFVPTQRDRTGEIGSPTPNTQPPAFPTLSSVH